MRFDGEWLECEDGIARPVMRAEILAADGSWRSVELLVDTGADRTVISANVLEALNLDATGSRDRIGGVGGLVNSVNVRTQIRLTREDGHKVIFRGDYAACTDHEALDMTVLGRDLLDMFAVIVDRRGSVVAIIGGQHGYTVHPLPQS
jgi:predicted aspartyl protease